MIYRVLLDGNDILDYRYNELTLISPVLTLEVNTAGTFEFTMPPYHKYYDSVKIMKSTIEVYEDNTMLWFGRPVEQTIDFYKQKKYYCEGPLSFFNDTVQYPGEYENIRLSVFFRDVIAMHNTLTGNRDRDFEIGRITIEDSVVYRKVDYSSTYDVLKGMCLDTVEGYLLFRRVGGINYIDWVKDLTDTNNQPIEFGINLLDYSSDFDATEFATVLLPLGKTDSETELPLTITDVTGSDVIKSDAVATYGQIIKVQRWSDISDPYELYREAQTYLNNIQFNSLVIECSAADLHAMQPNYNLFQLGQQVHCISQPHFIDREFPISKMTVNLDSAAKQITLGVIKKKTLTRITKEERENTDYDDTQDYGDTGDYGGYDTGLGEDWELIPPEEPGEPVTAIRVPTYIKITKSPNKTTYKSGETLDFSGISVEIRTKYTKDDGTEVDSIWTKAPRYLDGKVPYAELSFSTKTAPNISEFSVMVTWKYNGKSYSDTLQLTTNETEAPVYQVWDLTKWTRGAMNNFTITANHVSGQMISGNYEKLYYKIDCGANTPGIFTLSCYGTWTEKNRTGTHAWIAVCSQVPASRYIEDQSNIVINKVQVTPGGGTYRVPFNSGNNETVYLVIDYAAMTDGAPVELSYSDISLTLY